MLLTHALGNAGNVPTVSVHGAHSDEQATASTKRRGNGLHVVVIVYMRPLN